MEGVSIITPHYNYSEGLELIFKGLQKQSSDKWEWIIVDDCSSKDHLESIEAFISLDSLSRIRLLKNKNKTNASVCRNIGLEKARNSTVVFLDSDDLILEDFVKSRLKSVHTFQVYPNFYILNEKDELIPSPGIKEASLDSFLKADFIWQTTCVLWSKDYLLGLGGFDSNLNRLQDIELVVRALLKTQNYEILDNSIDFYYRVEPIRLKTNFVPVVCNSVTYFITKILKEFELDKEKRDYLKGYFYLCVKYLHRSQNKSFINDVLSVLKVFKKTKLFDGFEYYLGFTFLGLYTSGIIGPEIFLKLNRYFFKPV